MTRCDDFETRKLENIDYFSLSDPSIVGFVFDADQYFGSSISRDRKEPLQVDLVCPSSNDVGCAQKLVRCRWMPLYFNRDEQQIAEAMRDSASPQS